MNRTLIFGPPGTGKTQACLVAIEGWLKNTPVDQIAYSTFMREATSDACRRFNISEDQRRDLWFRTVHSTAFRVLGYTKDRVVTPKWLSDFGASIGLETVTSEAEALVEEAAEAVLRIQKQAGRGEGKPGAFYLGLYNLSRLYCRTVDELDAVRVEPHKGAYSTINFNAYNPQTYASFVSMYEAAKVRDGKVDFCDMMENVLREHPERPPWRCAVIDEAQDLSALQHSVADYLFDDCDEVIMAGDDDQAVLGFCGSRASDFLAYRKNSRVIDLQQTHRFGDDIVRFAAMIAKQIEYRHDKNVVGLSNVRNPIRFDFQLDPKSLDGESTLILHRHISGCNEIGHRLVAAGVPFWSERGINPLGRTADISVWRAWSDICAGRVVDSYQLGILMDRFPSVKNMSGEKVRMLVHGAKKKISEMTPGTRISQQELPLFLSDALLQMVEDGKPPEELDVHWADYYANLAAKGFKFDQKPAVTVTTIHGSKGREARHVYLFSEAFPQALDPWKHGGNLDDEHRVAYVGATRTKGDLTILQESLCGDWTSRYPYPET